jgi:hypothetical protein
MTINQKTVTLKDVKFEAARLGLQVNNKYDKRFINTWLYTIGHDVIPVERKLLVHVSKPIKKPLTLSDFISLAKDLNK